MKHHIVSYSPFIVEFKSGDGKVKRERYNVVLTKREIMAEYDYIVFPD